MEKCEHPVENKPQQDNNETTSIPLSDTVTSDVENISLEAKIAMIKLAANDSLFMASSKEAMTDFAYVDAEWWERKE